MHIEFSVVTALEQKVFDNLVVCVLMAVWRPPEGGRGSNRWWAGWDEPFKDAGWFLQAARGEISGQVDVSWLFFLFIVFMILYKIFRCGDISIPRTPNTLFLRRCSCSLDQAVCVVCPGSWKWDPSPLFHHSSIEARDHLLSSWSQWSVHLFSWC